MIIYANNKASEGVQISPKATYIDFMLISYRKV